MKLTLVTASALLAVTPITASVHHKHTLVSRDLENANIEPPTKDRHTYQGCFKVDDIEDDFTPVGVTYGATSGGCFSACEGSNVFAMQGNNCFCGKMFPPKDAQTKNNAKCKQTCKAWKGDPCPEAPYAAIWNTGKIIDTKYAPSKKKSSTSSSSSSASATDEDSTSTAVKTAVVTHTQGSSPEETSDDPDKKKGGSSNTVGIAVGVVVGVVAAAAIIGGVFFWLRRKRNAEIEEDHRRNAAVNAFISGSKPPSTSGGLSMTDARLDPVLAHRRLSDGSIADNEDYSRRILRVSHTLLAHCPRTLLTLQQVTNA